MLTDLRKEGYLKNIIFNATNALKWLLDCYNGTNAAYSIVVKNLQVPLSDLRAPYKNVDIKNIQRKCNNILISCASRNVTTLLHH